MIYLTFDSNIWIYSLDESWQIENQLDYIEHWIQNGEVKLLLPKMIIDEWDKHEEEQVRVREKKLKEFFEMAEEILPSAFYAEYKEPSTQRIIIDNQLRRVKDIILSSEIIPDYPEIKQRVIEDGIAKKAPLHRKSSVADAIIVFSLIHYAKLNPGNNYFFITNNTDDFYQKADRKKEIHPDLKPDFDACNIKSFTTLNELTYFLKTYGLKINGNINQIRKERIRNKIKEKIYNPEYDKLTESGKIFYIQNINTIEFILKEKKPTKEQVIFVLALIDSDSAYQRDFYKKISNGNWFEILKRKGVFNPKNNPVPIQVNEGFQIPFWEPLGYLEKLSLQIKIGNELEYIDEIIEIINEVSQKPVDNYITWNLVIKILSNLPRERIPLAILTFIPTWLQGNFKAMLQSSEICQNLLPKFLTENATLDDVEKAELILKYLFSVEKVEAPQRDALGLYAEGYRSRVYMHYLLDSLIEKKLTIKIAAICSDEIITYLADSIKKLRFDFPKGINFSIKMRDEEYSIKVEIDNKSLDISIAKKNNPKKIVGIKSILNFENLNSEQIKKAFIIILEEFGIDYEKNQENELNVQMLTNALANGSYYSFSDDSISKLNDRHYRSDKAAEVFSLIFRDLLNEKNKQNARGIALLKLFVSENKYRLPFFRKVVLFVIGENWEVTKTLFFEIIQDNDPMHIFSDQYFENELYEVLNKNQAFFNKDEIKRLKKIIDFGPQDESEDKNIKNINYWKLRWYSAMRNISPFKRYYEKFSKSGGWTNEHYENIGKVRVMASSVSPISIEEILQKSNREIVEFIQNFKPKDRWEEPNIDGLCNALNKAVENDPEKFSNGITLYKDVYYIYVYHIANGFREAWKNKRQFNWEKVLTFFNEYVKNEKFISGQLSLDNDSWGATQEWVAGVIGNLLTEGTQSDNNAFDLTLLPMAKEILKTIAPSLRVVENFGQTNMDYPTYSLNSTAGKILRALLDYSLRRVRNLKPEDKLPKWEEDIKNLMQGALKNRIIDAYILTGWHFQQFYFLDKDWITNKVKDFYNLEDNEWLAFLGGFAFGNPPFNKEVYQLFYPHYERLIQNNVQIKSFYDRSIIRHLVAFYFWEFEDLKTQGLLLMLLDKGSHSSILELVNFVWRQEKQLRGLNGDESKKLEKMVLDLWTFLAVKYENSKDEGEKEILVALSNWLEFAAELDEEYTNLVLKSIKLPDKEFHSYYLIGNLAKLKDYGKPNKTAKHIGVILNSIQFTPHFSSIEDKHIVDLVVFLYKNEQYEVAVEFCNKMAKQGHDFLIDIHNKYKRQ